MAIAPVAESKTGEENMTARYRYRFLVDGEWRDDPDCKFTIANPFGNADAVVRVGRHRSMK